MVSVKPLVFAFQLHQGELTQTKGTIAYFNIKRWGKKKINEIPRIVIMHAKKEFPEKEIGNTNSGMWIKSTSVDQGKELNMD